MVRTSGHVDAAQIGATKTDAEVGGRRLERKRDLSARMETYSRA
jgi:hypothetical protein